MEYNQQVQYSPVGAYHHLPSPFSSGMPYNYQVINQPPLYQFSPNISPVTNDATANNCIQQIVGNSSYYALSLEERLTHLHHAVSKIGNEVRSITKVIVSSTTHRTQSDISHLHQAHTNSQAFPYITHSEALTSKLHTPPIMQPPTVYSTADSNHKDHITIPPPVADSIPADRNEHDSYDELNSIRVDSSKPLIPTEPLVNLVNGSISSYHQQVLVHEITESLGSIIVDLSSITFDTIPQIHRANCANHQPKQNRHQTLTHIPGNGKTLNHG